MSTSPAFTVALLGAESTGKSQLLHTLANTLQRDHGIVCLAVPEHLRTWCEAQGRAPRQDEQAGIALAQGQAIAAAQAQPGVQVVLADTTAVMVAAYSEQYFGDHSLWPQALAEQARCGLTLLMGLDLPWVDDGLCRDSPEARTTTDAILRSRLDVAGVRYQTVHGQGERRATQALRAIGAALGRDLVAPDPYWSEGRGRLDCGKCGDPACEHRLFRDLIERRGGPAA